MSLHSSSSRTGGRKMQRLVGNTISKIGQVNSGLRESYNNDFKFYPSGCTLAKKPSSANDLKP